MFHEEEPASEDIEHSIIYEHAYGETEFLIVLRGMSEPDSRKGAEREDECSYHSYDPSWRGERRQTQGSVPLHSRCGEMLT